MTSISHLSYVDALADLFDKKIPFVQITAVEVRGSAPCEQGAKALVTASGIQWGTVGGGNVEAHAIRRAQDLLKPVDGAPVKNCLITWNLQRDVGMTCGGEVKFFFEAHQLNQWTIAVFGAGHVAQKLVPLLCDFDAEVHVIDPRREWLDRFAKRSNLHLHECHDAKDVVPTLPKDTFFVLVSQGHSTDVPALLEVLKRPQPAPYVGVIGSHNKRLIIKRELKEHGISDPTTLESFICPMGLAIGTSAPAEIAISISAQLLEYRDKFYSPTNP